MSKLAEQNVSYLHTEYDSVRPSIIRANYRAKPFLSRCKNNTNLKYQITIGDTRSRSKNGKTRNNIRTELVLSKCIRKLRMQNYAVAILKCPQVDFFQSRFPYLLLTCVPNRKLESLPADRQQLDLEINT